MLILTMLRYRTLDNAIFEANSNIELVEQLRDDSWTPSIDIQDFMQQMAHRCQLYSNARIRTDNPDTFVNDLITSGHLTIIE